MSPKVSLLSYTQLDPVLAGDNVIRQGLGSLQENLIEYAGRVCYRSDTKMGRNPGFISLRMREGHEDIIEHVRFVFRVEAQPLDRDVLLLVSQPSLEYTDLGGDSWIFSMNARNIRDYWRQSQSELAQKLLIQAQNIAPTVFSDIDLMGEVPA